MRRRFVPTLCALACGLALAGCGRSQTSSDNGGIGRAESPETLVRTLNSFTDELLTRIEKAPDTKAGLAEAQALLDARKGDFTGRVAAL